MLEESYYDAVPMTGEGDDGGCGVLECEGMERSLSCSSSVVVGCKVPVCECANVLSSDSVPSVLTGWL